MMKVEEALDKVLSYFKTLEKEHKPLLESLGQVLADDVVSGIDIPPLDSAAMDGYAVRSSDTLGAGAQKPMFLRVIAEVAAGDVPEGDVSLGTAVRIMTGAPVPRGADSVVRFEDTDEDLRKSRGQQHSPEIGILRETPAGQNVRKAGEDISRGSMALPRGTVLRPAHIGVLASVGLKEAPVIRRPVVGILATGNELVDVGLPLGPGKIYTSNTFSLAAQVLSCGGIPQLLGIATDDKESLTNKIYQGLSCDLLLTSGGVSKGDYDIVKDVLAELGEIKIWTVRMKPGKPLAFGIIKGRQNVGVPHLGLPGFPVSSMVSFEVFARPAILKMMGKEVKERPTVTAILQDDIENKDRRRVFARVIVSKSQKGYVARLTGSQGSGILTSMAHANGLAIIPEEVSRLSKGEAVRVFMLDWSETQESD